MNKAVILIFMIVVGAVLIGIPMYRFFNPEVLPGYDDSQVTASTNPDEIASLSLQFENTTWAVSHHVNADLGYGQAVPIMVDFEITFAPNEKLKCNGHIFSDVQLPASYQNLKAQMEQGWEGKWELSKNGELIKYKMDNPFGQFKEIAEVYPFSVSNSGGLMIVGDAIVYRSSGSGKYELKRLI